MNWKRITICGGGNAAHALLALLLSDSDSRLNLYLPLEEEFRRFESFKEGMTPFALVLKGEEYSIPMERLFITANPEEAAKADLVILAVPAFAHKDILSSLAPYLREGTVLAALPARGGFEFQASAILHENKKQGIILAGFQTLPWACRIKEYAQSVEIFGQKMRVGVASLPSHYGQSISRAFGGLLKLEFLPYSNMLELTLSNQGQIIHPGIMCGAFSDKLGRLYREDRIPLFYRSVDENTADLLEAMSGEILKVRSAVEKILDLNLDAVTPISRWMLESYGDEIEDRSTLSRMFQTNHSYRALKVPARPVNGLYQIDVRSRYITEDIPYGLLVSKAIAELSGVCTPRIDGVIETAGRWLDAQYLIEGKLKGRHLAETRVPQNFGLEGLEAIAEMLKRRT